MRFHDRAQAGQLLAKELAAYAGRRDVVVLALPRGGIPVAFEIAQELQAPMDAFIVRKLGVPSQPELAMGAIASGVQILNGEVITALRISPETVSAVAAVERVELERREKLYRCGRLPPRVGGRAVILVDDGIATGSTVRAAVAALRVLGPRKIVVATPTIAFASFAALRTEVDELVALMAPVDFRGVGDSYETFPQTDDDEASELLSRCGPVPT